MKVTRVNTSSFSISKELQGAIKRKFDDESHSGQNVTLEGKYAPLAKFKVVRRDKIATGSIKFLAMQKSIYEEKGNYMHVDLSNAKLLYVTGKRRGSVELGEVDFFERLMTLPATTVSALGYLLEQGSTKKEEVQPEILTDLTLNNLAEEYKYERNIFIEYAFREVGDFVGGIPEGKADYVRATHRIPPFNSPQYDLGRYLEADDTIEATYSRNVIKYSEDQISGILATLFRSKVELAEIIFLPYYQYSSLKAGSSNRETHVLACLKGQPKSDYKNPLKLTPMSVYSMDVGGKVIPIEGDIIKFDDIADLKQAKEEIRRRIVYPLKLAADDPASAYTVSGGILFYGPPGCGKTYLAKAIVGEVGISFISGNIEDILSEGSDMAAKKLHDIFDYARSASPCVLFFDEIDAIASRRDIPGASVIVNQLLTELDGVLSLSKNTLVIGATNMPWRLDPALIRGGRFTEQIYIRPPDFESRVEMFDLHLKKFPDLAPGVSARELASLTEFYSASDIKTVVDRAAMLTLESSAKAPLRKRRIQQWHLIQALKERKPSLIAWFKFAAKQMEVEGAKESYPELWTDIKRFQAHVSRDHTESAAGDLRTLMTEWKNEERRPI
ncbi:MAG: ATP-binding protein [Candidatus Altiarchaeota archaeon]|nr:ATP-binding protein [Candidatus Altiarchaeota archaeon]